MRQPHEAHVTGKGRWLIWLALLLYGVCFASRHALSGQHHVMDHAVPDYLLSGTLFLVAFIFHVAGLMTSPYYRRSALTWVSAFMVVVGAALLARDWLRLLA